MTDIAAGAAVFPTAGSDFNATEFIVRQVLSEANFSCLVEIVEINGDRVNVHPLVNQIDGFGKAIPHGVVNNLVWFQLQSGVSAIKIEPVKGDIGLAVIADRDISSVVANAGQANPGSMRRNSLPDGIYIGGIRGLNAEPTQFIDFAPEAGGISVTTPANFSVNAGGQSWVFGASGLVLSTGIVAETHRHISATPGIPTGGPIA